MRKRLFVVIAFSLLTPPAWSASCLPKPLQSGTLPYEQGNYLPVVVGPYQFNLPSKPSALLAFDGVMAAYPKKKYISYQTISTLTIAATLAQFTTRSLSAASLDRYLYGLNPIDDLNKNDQRLINEMRADLKLDCQTRLALFHVTPNVEVLFHEALLPDLEHKLLIFSKSTTHLISINGSKKTALEVLQSIKNRDD